MSPLTEPPLTASQRPLVPSSLCLCFSLLLGLQSTASYRSQLVVLQEAASSSLVLLHRTHDNQTARKCVRTIRRATVVY